MKKFRLALPFLALLFFSDHSYASGFAPAFTDEQQTTFMWWAFLLGAISAISLVIGSALGLIWKPSARITAAFTAFGAGALLAALSIELMAPTVMEFVEDGDVAGAGHDKSTEFFALLIGCAAGGIMFYALNELLNSQGGYLRKVSTTISQLNRFRISRYKHVLTQMSKLSLFNSIPAEHLDILVRHLKPVHVSAGTTFMRKGEPMDRFYIIESGEVDVIYEEGMNQLIGAGQLLGERSLLKDMDSESTMVAKTELSLFEISKNDFNKILEVFPDLRKIMHSEARKKMLGVWLGEQKDQSEANADWVDQASEHLHSANSIPTKAEIDEQAEKHDSAPLSIWLGIFLDGIPESFVIGAGFLIMLGNADLNTVGFMDIIPYTLVAGLFLSNFPEAMSSSIGMSKMGWKPTKILAMWSSLLVLTALGSLFGFYIGSSVPNYIEIGVEGLAAGAMLTMIAQTMIPEAVHIGGSRVTGLSTLAGYLGAVAFKIFE